VCTFFGLSDRGQERGGVLKGSVKKKKSGKGIREKKWKNTRRGAVERGIKEVVIEIKEKKDLDEETRRGENRGCQERKSKSKTGKGRWKGTWEGGGKED